MGILNKIFKKKGNGQDQAPPPPDPASVVVPDATPAVPTGEAVATAPDGTILTVNGNHVSVEKGDREIFDGQFHGSTGDLNICFGYKHTRNDEIPSLMVFDRKGNQRFKTVDGEPEKVLNVNGTAVVLTDYDELILITDEKISKSTFGFDDADDDAKVIDDDIFACAFMGERGGKWCTVLKGFYVDDLKKWSKSLTIPDYEGDEELRLTLEDGVLVLDNYGEIHRYSIDGKAV